MAISRMNVERSLTINSNYGEVDGKVVRKKHNYKHVCEEISDDAIYAVYEAIDGMQEPTAENCILNETVELIED